MISQSGRILALCGGVGGAKLALGLTETMAPEHLTIVVNTGDDFTHLGLHVSPDLDTVMYTLAGLANPETGWGRRDESWNFLAALEALGGETWFRLGDRDLATHVERTRRRAAGESLSQITADFHRRLGIRTEVLPMSDDPVRTMLETDAGRLAFQDYFVRRRAEPAVHHIEYAGCEQAGP
jgi:LPPG:FO 2-phospho-L-lactate transferase